MKTKDEIRDQRYKQKYGITLEEYTDRLLAQGGVCAICQRPPKSKSLHVDHDHKVSRVKVSYGKSYDIWVAQAEYNQVAFIASGVSKSAASKMIRHMLKGASWRGILCWTCNKSLQSFRDNPTLMRAAAAYLERFQNHGATPPPTTSGEKS